jgi:protease I
MTARKRIALLVEDDFEDAEVIEPLRAMNEAGISVVIVGSGTKTTYKGKRGSAAVEADIIASDVLVEEFDAVIIPGGYAPEKMRMCRAMIDLVKKANDTGKIIAAVCHGPQLLISAGIVRGRCLTSCPSIAIDLTNAGATWVDEPVVREGNLITSRKTADLPKFDQAIVTALS